MRSKAINVLIEMGVPADIKGFQYIVDAMELFADECLLPYLNRFESERDDTLLESFGLNDEERKRWDIPLIQRIFHPDLPKHMQASLNEKDLEKIRINRENM